MTDNPYELGWRASMDGAEPSENPYPPMSYEAMRWELGRRDGVAEDADNAANELDEQS